jgi:hypothetical protein
MSAYKRGKRRVLISFIQATAVTALFALICPAVIAAIVMAYARFIISKSVEIEWNMLGMLGDPLGLVACGAVFVGVLVWRIRR